MLRQKVWQDSDPELQHRHMLRSAPKGDLSEPARFEGGLFYILLQARPAPRGKTAGCHSVSAGCHEVQAPRDSSRATFDPRQLCQQTWRAVHSTPMPILSAFNPKGTCPMQCSVYPVNSLQPELEEVHVCGVWEPLPIQAIRACCRFASSKEAQKSSVGELRG